MGKRTKWQQYDVAQLILDVQTKSVQLKRLREAGLDKGEIGEESKLYVKQDEENILLE